MSTLFALRTRLAKLAHQARFLPRTLALIRSAAPALSLLWLALLLAQALLPVAVFALTRSTLDHLLAALHSHSFTPTLASASLLALSLLALELLAAAAAHVRSLQSDLVRDHILSLIHAQSLAVDLSVFASSDFHDRLHRARSDASWRPILLLEDLGAVLQNSITLAGIALLLASISPFIPLALAAAALPALALLLHSNLQLHAWRRAATPSERRARYLSDLLTSSSAAPELRLFSLGPSFQSQFSTLRASLRAQARAFSLRHIRARALVSLIAFSAAAAAAAFGLRLTLNAALSPGSLLLLCQSLLQGLRYLQSLLESASSSYSNILFLEDLFAFLDLQPLILPPPNPLPVPAPPRSGFALTNVSFSYPNAPAPALHNLSLSIPASQITAIVGPNGSGKSTLVKLLCRFYDPSSGAISLDHTDLRHLDPSALRQSISALLQEPARFHDSFAQNIAFGDTSRPFNPSHISAAARAAGALSIAASLPNGILSPLGREFSDGAELSTGQWQRLALARAFYRNAPILILDEPTSALDPWAEAEWLARFRSLAAGRTALYITHRFSAARHADLILVLQNGQLAESGSHPQLLALNGLYAQAWRTQ